MAPYQRAKANRYNFAVAFFVALGSFTYGFNSAIIGAVIGQPSFYEYFKFEASSSFGGSFIGACNGLYAGAGVIGSLTVFWFLNVLGRKRAIQVISICCVISAAIQAGSVHIAMFLVGRFLNGLAVGWINCTVPLYMSEIAPAKQRGRLVGTHGLIICSAYGAASWAGFGTYYETNPTIQWRLLVTLQCVAPLLLLIGSPWIPESPRWLIMKGRDQQGLEILRKLHENHSEPNNVGAREEFVQIQQQLAMERKQNVSNLWQILKVPSYRKRMFYGFWLQAAVQSTGVLVISNYMVIELNNLGIKGSHPLLVLGAYFTWSVFMNFMGTLLLDRVGRIRLLTISLVGSVVSVLILTALTAQYGGSENTNKVGAGFAVAFMWVFTSFYGVGIDVPVYVYCSEIFPTNIRAHGVGVSVAALFLMTTVYTTAAGPAFNHISWKYYILFVVVCSAMIPFIVWKFPETKGLSLEEIGALFGDEVALDLSHLSESERQELDERLEYTLTANMVNSEAEIGDEGAKQLAEEGGAVRIERKDSPTHSSS